MAESSRFIGNVGVRASRSLTGICSIAIFGTRGRGDIRSIVMAKRINCIVRVFTLTTCTRIYRIAYLGARGGYYAFDLIVVIESIYVIVGLCFITCGAFVVGVALCLTGGGNSLGYLE